MAHTRVQVGERTVQISYHRPTEKVIKTRVYVTDELTHATDEKLQELLTAERELGDQRHSTRGEYPEVDRLYDRLNRSIARVKRTLAVDTVRELLGDQYITGRFSRHAGCSCPCSPGVVLNRTIMHNDRLVSSIWVS